MQDSAVKHLVAAAANGDAAAQFNLGILCDSRVDDNEYPTEGNRGEAMKWLLAAAEQGLPRAQSKLAEMYAAGAMADDHVSACGWFLVAAKRLSGIHRDRARSGYEAMSSQLTPTQLARARGFAGIWQPKLPADAASTGIIEEICS
jgi:TPR repeat protein